MISKRVAYFSDKLDKMQMSAGGTGNGILAPKVIAPAILIGVITVILSLPYHTITVFDSGDYLRCAVQLNSGVWNLKSDFYAARLAAYIPYSAGIALFGFGEWLTYITLAELLLLLLLVYVLVSPYSKPVAIFTILILSTSQIMLGCSATVMGDTLLALSANTVILIYLWFFWKEEKTLASARKSGALAAFAFSISFWTKESAVFFVPLMIYFLVCDRKDIFLKEFWKYVFGIALLLSLVMPFAHRIKTGDPFYRMHFMEHQTATTDIDYDAASWQTLLLRCTVQPFQFLLQDYTFAVLLLLSVLHVIQPVETPLQKKLKAYFIITLITWWLGSQSVFKWNPMALTHRLWLPLLVPMAINGACAAWPFTQHRTYTHREKLGYTMTIALFLLGAFISLYISMNEYSKIERSPTGLILSTVAVTATAIVLLGLMHVGKLRQFRLARISLPVAIILPQAAWQIVTLFVWMSGGQPNEYRGEKEMVEELKRLKPTLVLSDAGLYRNYGIYDGFQQSLPFIFYLDASYDSLHDGTYMLLNRSREKENAVNVVEAVTFARSQNRMPEFVLHPQQYDFELVKENETDQLFVLKR